MCDAAQSLSPSNATDAATSASAQPSGQPARTASPAAQPARHTQQAWQAAAADAQWHWPRAHTETVPPGQLQPQLRPELAACLQPAANAAWANTHTDAEAASEAYRTRAIDHATVQLLRMQWQYDVRETRHDLGGEETYEEVAAEMQLRTADVRKWHKYWSYAMRGPTA